MDRLLLIAAKIIAIQFAEIGKVAVPIRSTQGGTDARAEYDKNLRNLTAAFDAKKVPLIIDLIWA